MTSRVEMRRSRPADASGKPAELIKLRRGPLAEVRDLLGRRAVDCASALSGVVLAGYGVEVPVVLLLANAASPDHRVVDLA
jgi:hypothetical protein